MDEDRGQFCRNTAHKSGSATNEAFRRFAHQAFSPESGSWPASKRWPEVEELGDARRANHSATNFTASTGSLSSMSAPGLLRLHRYVEGWSLSSRTTRS